MVHQVALVTGGNSGIGFQVARVLLIKGATVVIAGRSEERLLRFAPPPPQPPSCRSPRRSADTIAASSSPARWPS